MARTGCVVFLEPGVDWTVFGFTGLARDLDAAWRVFADRVVHPSLAAPAVAPARGKLLTRARTRYSNPHERIHILATSAAVQDHRAIPPNYILAYFTGPPPTSRSYWAFRVATALLSSQLHRTVRAERSLSYAAFAPFIDQAIPVGGAYASTPQPQQVLPLMLHAIEILAQSDLDYFALSHFVDGFTFDYLADNSSAADQAEFLARAELYLGNYRLGDDFVKRLRGVRPEEIRAVAREYMSHIQYAYLGDTLRMHGHWKAADLFPKYLWRDPQRPPRERSCLPPTSTSSP